MPSSGMHFALKCLLIIHMDMLLAIGCRDLSAFPRFDDLKVCPIGAISNQIRSDSIR